MNATPSFNETIKSHLDSVAEADPLFAAKYHNPEKNLKDCITYILNWVKAQGCNGFTQGEIFGQAMHYYDEEKINVGQPVSNYRVAIAQPGEAPQAAPKTVATPKAAPRREPKPQVALPSLFD